MATQFEDEKISAKHKAQCYSQLDNGKYKVTVRQLFSPSQYVSDGNINFEVVIQADGMSNPQYINEVFGRSEKFLLTKGIYQIIKSQSAHVEILEAPTIAKNT